MDNPRFAKTIFALLLAAFYFNWMRIYSELPQKIAIHFGFDGTPNGWAPKDGLLWTTLIVAAILSVTVLLPPRLIRSLASDRMNLPNKEYWLAPEHREQTMGFIEAQSVWFGCAVLLVLFTAFWLAARANLAPDKRFDSDTMWTALGIFFVVVIVWMVHFVRHFYRVPK